MPTPMHPLTNFARYLNGPELWVKRDDLTGLVGGGNKSRKLEFLVGEAIEIGADTLVTVGAIQSNHTRQVAAIAARSGLKAALIHCAWADDAGPAYREVGNILLSSILGAELYLDDRPRPIEDQSPLISLVDHLAQLGRRPYLIPGGASEHRLGSLGYVGCAAEIVDQGRAEGVGFDYLIHCTGSGSTQAGLLAGFAALGIETRVIGVSDDDETEIKRQRVHELANNTLEMLGYDERVPPRDVEIVSASTNAYGLAADDIYEGIAMLAQSEGLVADPVYEGKAIRGLLNLSEQGRFGASDRILLMHLGGTPAVHAYASQFPPVEMIPFEL